jgi:hypothetical protein
MTPLNTEKIAVLAPIPSANVKTATAVNPSHRRTGWSAALPTRFRFWPTGARRIARCRNPLDVYWISSLWDSPLSYR